MATKLSENFTLEELIKTSQKANNTPTTVDKAHLTELCQQCLQPLRNYYKKGISINSGYRSAAVNKLIGGSTTSAHSIGYAADTKPSNGNMVEYQKAVLEWAKTAKFDQIIIEYPTNYVARWIHIGWKNRAGAQRKQILYTTNGKTYPAITSKFYLK